MKSGWIRIAPIATALCLAAAVMPAAAEYRQEEIRKLSPGGRFILEADAGSVDLRGSARSDARVVISSEDDKINEKFDFAVEEGAGTLKVTAKKKSSWDWSWGRSTKAPRFTVEVPEQTALQIRTGGGHIEIASTRGSADLSTSGGHVKVSSLDGTLAAQTSGGHMDLEGVKGDARIETSGGHIEVSDLRGSLDCRTSGGHIDLDGIAGDLKASTSGGHIEIEDAGGAVVAKTSGGSVEVAFARGNSKGGTIESSGGGITVMLDPAVSLSIEAETSGGSVSSDLPLTIQGEHSRSSLRGALGKGGETLRIYTSAGGVRIRALGPV